MNTRNFTLRLNADECAALEGLRELTNTNTDAAAIKIVILNYKHFYDRAMTLATKLKKKEESNDRMTKDINTFLFAFQTLNKYLP